MDLDHYILADVGGTNSRFGLGSSTGVIKASIRRYRNDDFNDFQSVLHCFLTENQPQNLVGGCIAVAGPVSNGSARLTNRPWSFDKQAILKATNAGSIRLVNDMSALGHTAPLLKSTQVKTWREVKHIKPNGQSLVIGLGTGVNISARIGNAVLAGEVGHSGLTLRMASLLSGALGIEIDPSKTVEDFLSGRGFESLYTSVSGATLSGADICNAARSGQDQDAVKTTALYTALAGEFLREMAVHYLPMNGIFLAGSLAGGIFETPSKNDVVEMLNADRPMLETLRDIPVSLITDDAAALIGCLEIAKAAT